MTDKKHAIKVTNDKISQFKTLQNKISKDARFITCHNTHYHKKSVPPYYKELPFGQALLEIQKDSDYNQVKILESTIFDNNDVVVIFDWDDHHGKGISDQFVDYDTFAIKSPSGEGRQLWFRTSSAHFTNNLFKYDDLELEVFVGFKSTEDNENNNLRACPGMSKKEGAYTVLNDAPIARLPSSLAHMLEKSDREFVKGVVHEIDPEIYAHRKSDFNSKENQIAAYNETSEILRKVEFGDKEPVLRGEGRGRDHELLVCALHILKHGVSVEFAKTQVRRIYDSGLFPDKSDFDSAVVDKNTSSAFNLLEGENGLFKLAPEFKDFPQDTHGHKIQSYEEYEKKARHLSKFNYQVIVSDQPLLTLFSQLIHYDRNLGMFFIPNIVSSYAYEKEMENYKHQEIVDYEKLMKSKAQQSLSWISLTVAQFKAQYPDAKGKTLYSNHVFRQNLNHSKIIINRYCHDKNFIAKDGQFYPISEPAVKPLDPQEINEIELQEGHNILKEIISWIVDPKRAKEETRWVMSRYAMLVQNPFLSLQNVHIMLGKGGSGKSFFTDVIRAIYPNSHSTVVDNVETIGSRFEVLRSFYVVDDWTVQGMTQAGKSTFKARGSRGSVSQEQKYIQREDTELPINMTICTNYDVDDREISNNRRVTITVNETPIDQTARGSRVREIMLRLIEDNWRMLGVIAHIMHNTNFEFDSKFKTQEQNHRNTAMSADYNIVKFCMYLYVNEGYIEDKNLLGRKYLNRNDVIYAMNYISSMYNAGESTEMDFVKDIGQKPLTLLLDPLIRNDDEKRRVSYYLKSIFTDPHVKDYSVLLPDDKDSYTGCWDTPTKEDLLRMMAIVTLERDDKSTVNNVIDMFRLDREFEEERGFRNPFDVLERFEQYDE